MSDSESIFQKLDFRRQLIWAVFVGMLILALVTSLAVSKTATDTIRGKLLEQSSQLTATFARQADFALLSSTRQFASDAIDLLLDFENVEAASIYDRQGKLYESKQNSNLLLPYNFSTLSDDAQLLREEGDYWHFAAPVYSEDSSMEEFGVDPTIEHIGYVVLVVDKSLLDTMFRDILRNNTLASLSVAILLLFALLGLASKLTKPLEYLSGLMRRAEDGEKQLRAHMSGPKDIVDMQHAFNTMMAVLEKRELELLQAKDAALESARVKGEFAANVSHELRTPMNAILGMLDLLMTMGLSPKQEEYVETAKSSGEILLSLIDDVLDFSKVESNAVVLNKEDVFVEDLLDEVVGLLCNSAVKRQVELSYVCSVDAPQHIQVDSTRMRQVLINLIGNAIKFTQQGEVSVWLSVESSRTDRGQTLRFDVKDTGIGIAPEAQERIFDAFTQADSSTTREYGGTGLGLAISRRIVSLMGGHMSLTSTLGEGSTFTFTVPLSEQEIISKPNSSKKLPKEFSNLRVLSVNSSNAVKEFLATRFGAWGVQHTALQNGMGALDAVRESLISTQPFHVLVMDEELAGIKALDFIKLLSDEPSSSQMTLVVLVNPWSEYEALYPDAVIQLTKPLRTGVLYETLRNLAGVTQVPSDSSAASEKLLEYFGKKVLVADDNRANQQVAVGMLERLGCEVLMAESGEQALNIVVRNQPDLVFMDCQMPVMDGYEATARIRRLEDGKNALPIIAMTANTSEGEEERCREAGMDDFLPKPLRLKDLQATLKEWFGSQHKQSTAVPVKAAGQPSMDVTLDLAVMDELRHSVGEVVDSMIKAFLEDTPVYLQSLKHAAADRDDKQVKELAHMLKGSASNFGADRLVALSRHIEEVATNSQLEDIDSQVAQLIAAYRELSRALEQQLSDEESSVQKVKRAGAGYSVLIADDDRSMRMALRNALEADDYSIDEASNGEHAVAICRRNMPDLILIDALMPEIDGFQACEQIRDLPNGTDIPILMITGLEDEKSIVKAFTAGASDYIPKPIHFSVMRQRVARLLQASKAEQHVKKMAYHDPLTGLPNRASLMQQLRPMINRALLNGEMVAVLFLDLDRFKMINDSLGHDAGDLLLKAVADRIRRCLREQDFVARLGGDEFTVVLEGLHNANVAAMVAQKICDSLSEPFVFLQQKMFITTSVGISLSPADGEDVGALIKHADSAMFRAKEKGNSYCFYEQGMEDEVYRRLELERELRQALEQDHLRLYYQPKVDAQTGQLRSAEALVRWQHPQRGLLMPDKFIPLAEESGLIAELGDWVLRAACKQIREWCLQGSELKVAVNISGREVQAEGLQARIESTLKEFKVPPSLLELEITESMLLEEQHHIIDSLNDIKATGITLAIDDFGSGYSSFNYLKHLPVDTLKIDRVFINDLDENDKSGRAIVAGIIALADNLGLETVAEGVETEEQQGILQELGCNLLQGYLFSKAIPAEQLSEQFLPTLNRQPEAETPQA
ncbi:EAL domain-containing protein [bacterium SCSIO 12696]|nr:EAL domain-containing protein [bacterium SCSIO 12696]